MLQSRLFITLANAKLADIPHLSYERLSIEFAST